MKSGLTGDEIKIIEHIYVVKEILNLKKRLDRQFILSSKRFLKR